MTRKNTGNKKTRKRANSKKSKTRSVATKPAMPICTDPPPSTAGRTTITRVGPRAGTVVIKGPNISAMKAKLLREMRTLENYRRQPKKPTLSLSAIRTAVADYMATEGCSCCRDQTGYDHQKETLGKLLKVKPYADGSGRDFSRYRSKK